MSPSRVCQVLLTGAAVGIVVSVTVSTATLASAIDPVGSGAARVDSVVQAQAPAAPEPSVRPAEPAATPAAPAVPVAGPATTSTSPAAATSAAAKPRVARASSTPPRTYRAVAPRPAPRSPYMVAARLERAWYPVYIGVGW